MKWKALLIFCIICIFIYSKADVVFAQGITGSVHDFSLLGWSGGEICVVCHTPHYADSTLPPLWNHELSSASYTLYSSPTLQENIQQPGRASKLCLSCHDGTVAIDSFGGISGISFVSGTALIGTDLSDDHPVGVTWNHQTLKMRGTDCFRCHKRSCQTCHTNPPEPLKMPLPFYGGLGESKVECATCHDPHDNVPAANGKLLRKPRAGSEICFHCHDKIGDAE